MAYTVLMGRKVRGGADGLGESGVRSPEKATKGYVDLERSRLALRPLGRDGGRDRGRREASGSASGIGSARATVSGLRTPDPGLKRPPQRHHRPSPKPQAAASAPSPPS